MGHASSYRLQHHQQDSAGLGLGRGTTPSKPSLKHGAEEKVDSSRGKGILEQWVSQSQPLSHTVSLFWIPGTHTCLQGCAVSPAHGDKGTQGHSVFWGATRGPPCHHGPGAAQRPSPAPQHMEQFLCIGTSACRPLGGIPLFWGVEHSMMSCTPSQHAGACPIVHSEPRSHSQLPEHLSIPPWWDFWCWHRLI